jgi:DNA-binding beta-propeller fold protein YncE
VVARGGGGNYLWVQPNTDKLYLPTRDNRVVVIDSKTDRVVNVIQPRAKGAGRVAASPDGRFVAATHGPEVSVIDVATKQIVADLKISPDDTGHGFPLFSPDSNTLHVISRGRED